ncbi:MAG: hypothetical protein ABIS20_03055 [Thermoanaerobaculia bacterium]
MKKQMKKLTLAKETLRGLEKRDSLRQVAGGLAGVGTVETGCNFCESGSCCTCVNGCDTGG